MILVGKITEIIFGENPSERAKKKLDFLSKVRDCQGLVEESSGDYIARFNGAIARYINETKSIGQVMDYLLAALASRDAKLAPGTVISLIFMLSCSSNKQSDLGSEYCFTLEVAALAICQLKTNKQPENFVHSMIAAVQIPQTGRVHEI